MLATDRASQPIAISPVALFDGREKRPNMTVIINGAIIQQVGNSAETTIPSDALVIDGNGRTLLPGLIDSHVHIESSRSLEQSLLFGVTTVLDMFSDPGLIATLKKQQNETIGSRMADLRSAGILVTAPRGHGTEYELEIPTLTKERDAGEFVNMLIRAGSDYIKIVYDDGSVTGRAFPTIDKETLAKVIDQAHKFGKMAVVHALSYESSRDAIELGCDGLVHLFLGRRPDDNFGDYAASRRVFVIPTLTVLESLCGIQGGRDLLDNSDFNAFLPKESSTNLRTGFQMRKELDYAVCELALKLLKKSNVPILAGTDAPNPGTTYGASIHRELELLVKAGMTPCEALTCATISPSEQFHLNDRGVIQEGKRADLLLVDGDPTEDIKDTRKIVKVWKQGVEFDREIPFVTNTYYQPPNKST